MDAKLLVVEGHVTKREVRLKLPTVIGRSRHADLTVNHAQVSREHCRIYELDGALVVRDNDSTNGTYVEGRRIVECVLRPGDLLKVGPLTFSVAYEHQGDYPVLDITKRGGHDATIEGAVPLSSDTVEAETAPPAAPKAKPADDTIGQGIAETIRRPDRFQPRPEELPGVAEPWPDFTAEEQAAPSAEAAVAEGAEASAEPAGFEVSPPEDDDLPANEPVAAVNEVPQEPPELLAPRMPAAEAVAETQTWFQSAPPCDDDLALPPPAIAACDEPAESVRQGKGQSAVEEPGPSSRPILIDRSASPGARANREKPAAKPAGKGLLGWLSFGKKRMPVEKAAPPPRESTPLAPPQYAPPPEASAADGDVADVAPPTMPVDDPPAGSGDDGLDSFLRKLR